mmetsp:Transcript_39683/g.60804  ORF Transcript_39683/g.60804 Transcript_39683/m.60804 type:complete len:80 (+) Transcript_39683:528-767(+)
MILESPLLKSTDKEYISSLTKKIDGIHSNSQANSTVLTHKATSINEHNQELVNAFCEGEEGVDFTAAQKENNPYEVRDS